MVTARWNDIIETEWRWRKKKEEKLRGKRTSRKNKRHEDCKY